MKKIILIAAMGLAASVNAQAQMYVGAGVGSSKADIDCAGTTACDTKGVAYKLFGGYNLSENFAIESSYFDLGKTNATALGVDMVTKAKGVELSGVLKGQFTPEFGGFVKGGLTYVKGSIDASLGGATTKFKESSVQPIIGAGVTYNITKSLRAIGEVTYQKVKFIDDADGKADVTTIGIGLSHSF